MMNPSPSEVVELFCFGASEVKPKPNKVKKAEVTSEEPSEEETQINATTPTTPKPKAKGQTRGTSQTSPAKVESKPPDAKKGGKGGGKGKRGKSEPRPEKRKQQCIPFFRRTCQDGDQCRYEHQVGEDGRPIPVGPKFSRSLTKQSSGTMRAKTRFRPMLRLRLEVESQHRCLFSNLMIWNMA